MGIKDHLGFDMACVFEVPLDVDGWIPEPGLSLPARRLECCLEVIPFVHNLHATAATASNTAVLSWDQTVGPMLHTYNLIGAVSLPESSASSTNVS